MSGALLGAVLLLCGAKTYGRRLRPVNEQGLKFRCIAAELDPFRVIPPQSYFKLSK
jgi:hypothetical protein